MEGQIVYLKNLEINKDEWNRCIESDVNAQPYALSWYLDIVSPKWQSLVRENSIGGYETVMPLTVKKQFGIPYLKQPFFCQQLGIFGKNSTEIDVVNAFLARVKDQFKYAIDYTFHSGFERHSNLFSNSTITQYLDLNRTYLEIYKGYNKDRKLNLKRAKASGLKLVESLEIEPLIQIFKAYTAHKIYGGVSEVAYQQLRDLFLEFTRREMVKLFYTKDLQGAYLTGGMFLIWKNKIIYLFNASTNEGKKKNGNTLILDHVIKTYSNQNYIFDFESPSEEFENIIGFYESFGSKVSVLPLLRYNSLPVLVSIMKSLRKKMHLILIKRNNKVES